MATLSFKQAFSTGWHYTKHHYGFLFVLMVIAFIFSIVGQAPEIMGLGLGISLVLSLVFILLGVLLRAGITKALLRLYDEKKGNLHDVYQVYPIFLPFLFSSILYAIAMIVGFILLIVPGIIVMVRGMFYAYVMIDKKVGAVDALKQSFEITKGNTWRLLGLVLVIAVINIIGSLPFGLGLLLTVPLTFMVMTAAYRQLSPLGDAKDPDALQTVQAPTPAPAAPAATAAVSSTPQSDDESQSSHIS